MIKIKNIPKSSDKTIQKWIPVCSDDFKGSCSFCYPLLVEAKKRKERKKET